MKKRVFAALMAGVMGTMMFGTTFVSAEAETPELKGEVYAFIAASLNNAMEEIQKNFNDTYPDVDKDSVVDLLENKVVLIKPKDGETKVTGFENITDAANLALAGEDVPVGQYSREIFDNLGITDEVNKMEINEGKNVTDVLASVSEGSNEVGIVYATDAASVADSVEVIAEAPEGSLKTPVLYPAGMVEDKEASDDDKAAAEAFLEYLQSDEALEVFEKYGFAAYVNGEKTDDMAAAEETAEPTEEASEDTAE